MIRVKLFEEEDKIDLEYEINDFLSVNNYIEVVDIKYNYVYITAVLEKYSALLIYNE